MAETQPENSALILNDPLPLPSESHSPLDQSFPVVPVSQSQGSIQSAVQEGILTQMSSYQPSRPAGLFETQCTPLHPHILDRWWEEDTLPILWSFNVGDIKRILRFRMYRDDEFPKRILRHRNTATLTEFLTTLLPTRYDLIFGLTHYEKVNELVRVCRTSSFQVSWSWFPDCVDDALPSTIALEIDMESILHFKTVPFEDWVRYCLGYPTSSVTWFLELHNELYYMVTVYLCRFPSKASIYAEVEKHLRFRSPWAHRAIFQCLQDRDLANPRGSFNNRISTFLVEPIQSFFASPSGPFVQFLKRLSVLSVRFTRQYHERCDINWATPFQTRFPHLNELVASHPITSLAKRLTYSNEREFNAFSLKAYDQNNNAEFQTLVDNWYLLSTSIEDCCIAFPEMFNYFKDCAKVLLSMRNYYAATAILYGLQEGEPTSYILSPLASNDSLLDSCFNLLDSTGNYAVYRRTMEERPGLPFLHPHIKEYRTRGRIAISRLFPLSL
ncbi:hypothetical protein LOZ58_004139 [Ophidiomyces ophidiicola]|nr:hypothetical protein LOZ66_002745 [Ophidiomyces ophidiicola]KAI1960416.1 hypothetical protein LOZ58_004139 [Ophidiomyces ophidiicola]